MATQPRPRVPKVGERWLPKSGNMGGFTVVESNSGTLTVDVDRVVSTDKQTGERKVDTRRRSLSPRDLEFFLLGYERKAK